MEPNWTKNISSATVCNFFYVFFVVYAVIFVVSVLMTVGIMTSKLRGALGIALGGQAIVITLIGGTMMLFYYLICDRALLANGKEGFFGTPTSVEPMAHAALPCPTGKSRNADGVCV